MILIVKIRKIQHAEVSAYYFCIFTSLARHAQTFAVSYDAGKVRHFNQSHRQTFVLVRGNHAEISQPIDESDATYVRSLVCIFRRKAQLGKAMLHVSSSQCLHPTDWDAAGTAGRTATSPAAHTCADRRIEREKAAHEKRSTNLAAVLFSGDQKREIFSTA